LFAQSGKKATVVAIAGDKKPSPGQIPSGGLMLQVTVDMKAIRTILPRHWRLSVDVAKRREDSDLYEAGLTRWTLEGRTGSQI
jgi:hypothetical protein